MSGLHPYYFCPTCGISHGEMTDHVQGERLCSSCLHYAPTVQHKSVVDHTKHHDHSFGDQHFRSDGPPEECLGPSCWALIQVNNLSAIEAALKAKVKEPEPDEIDRDPGLADA